MNWLDLYIHLPSVTCHCATLTDEGYFRYQTQLCDCFSVYKCRFHTMFVCVLTCELFFLPTVTPAIKEFSYILDCMLILRLSICFL